MAKDYFCIFAGGGVRGTAYVGALKALEELDINITGVAGSSVGAVVASLVAVECTHEEIKNIFFSVNYQKFQDFYIPIGKDFGICRGDEVYCWIKNKIEQKFNKSPVTFKDLEKELVIIATDISNTEFAEYSKNKTPDIEIAQAIRASISVPGFFKPVWENDRCIVDGEITNNFPIWKTESEIIANLTSRIIEFRLESSEKPKEIKNVFDYFNALLDTHYNVATKTLIREFADNDQFEIIRLNIDKVRILDFGISNAEKEQMVINGYNSVKRYFEHEIVEKRKKIEQIYSKTVESLKKFKNCILNGELPESLVILGELSIFFAENKRYIHKFIYNEFITLQNKVKNQDEILARIDWILDKIDNLEQLCY